MATDAELLELTKTAIANRLNTGGLIQATSAEGQSVTYETLKDAYEALDVLERRVQRGERRSSPSKFIAKPSISRASL
jgi:hypothetical protein